MMEIELSDDVLERFAIEVESLPSIYAQEEYERLIEEEKHWMANQQEAK